MKRMFFAVLVICLASITILPAQEARWEYGAYEIAPGLTLDVDYDGYTIVYRPPQAKEVIEETEHGVFSKIVFPEDDDFIEMTDNGQPMLPIKTLHLQLPKGCREIMYEMRERLYDLEYTEYKLSCPYMPAQNVYETSGDTRLQMDESVYKSDDWYGYVPEGVEFSKPYNYLGATGVALNIYPVRYNPVTNTVRVPELLQIRIPNIPMETVLRDGNFKPISIFTTNVALFYDNGGIDFTMDKGRMAIFTLPEFVPTLSEYVAYKDSCGYTVDVYPSDRWDATELRSFIHNIWIRDSIQYVLIVGHPDDIPYSHGEEGSTENPPTDYFYSCLESQYIDEEPFSPDILVGRWPVKNPEEIMNLTDKTIRYEHLVYSIPWNQRRTAIFSGTGDWQWLLYSGAEDISTKFKNVNLPFNIYDGRDFPSQKQASSVMAEALKRNPFMFVYNGHGTIDLIGKPYKIGTLKYPLTTDRTRIDLLPDCDIQPLSFLFGCSMNGKATEKGSTIGMDWICSFPYKGGTSCLAATTISYIDKNNALSKAIFNQLPTNGYGNIRLGEFIQNGMTKYIGCIHPY